MMEVLLTFTEADAAFAMVTRSLAVLPVISASNVPKVDPDRRVPYSVM
jgi:hypothetical protein